MTGVPIASPESSCEAPPPPTGRWSHSGVSTVAEGRPGNSVGANRRSPRAHVAASIGAATPRAARTIVCPALGTPASEVYVWPLHLQGDKERASYSPPASRRGALQGEYASVAESRSCSEHAGLLPDDDDAPLHKQRVPCGHLPLRGEVFPPSGAATAAGVIAGLLCGLRVCLTTAGYATIIFMMPGCTELNALFPTGVHILWLSAAIGIAWNGIFGRLQYSIADIQGAVAMQLCDVVSVTANSAKSGHVAATVLAALSISSLAIALGFLAAGSLRFGRLVLQFPISATCGFLASVGSSLARAGVMLATQTSFTLFWPKDWGTDPHGLTRRDSIAQLTAAAGVVVSMRFLPRLLQRMWPKPKCEIQRLFPAVATLMPLAVFYAAIVCANVSIESLRDRGWVYTFPPDDRPNRVFELRSQHLTDWDAIYQPGVILRILILVLVALVSSPIALVSISDQFVASPPLAGDPAPLAPLNIDAELRMLGTSAVVVASVAGLATYHSLGNSVATRLEGGTHRISSYAAAVVLLLMFLLSVPLQAFVPKFFLAGILLNIGLIFLKQSMWDTRHMLPYKEYLVTLSCLVVELFTTQLVYSLSWGILVAIVLFVYQASRHSAPLAAVATGTDVRSTVRRPDWEIEHLNAAARCTLVLRLSGLLFFGTVARVSSKLQSLFESEQGQGVRFVVLDFTEVTYADASTARGFGAVRLRAKAAGKSLVFCSLPKDIADLFVRAGALEGDVDLFPDCDSALEACEELLLADCCSVMDMRCRWATASVERDDASFSRLTGMSAEVISCLRRCATIEFYEPGAAIAEHGKPCEDLLIVRCGVVDVLAPCSSCKPPDGSPRRRPPQRRDAPQRRRRRQRITCGCFVAHDAFIAGLCHQGDIVVPSDVECGSTALELWRFPRSAWDELQREDPRLHGELLHLLVVDVARQSVRSTTCISCYAGAEFADRARSHSGAWV